MKNLNRNLGWIIPITALCSAVIFLLTSNKYVNTQISSDALLSFVHGLTRGYKLRQIICTFSMFLVGLLVAICIWKKESIYYAMIWAMPIAVVIWSVGSMFLLFSDIPYNVYTSFFVFLLLSGVIVYRNRMCLRKIKFSSFMKIGMVTLSAIIFFSIGVLPTIMSSDSYYYIMQYGEIIAKAGKLSFDLVGSTMTWTGISSSFLSCLAVFGGFETIVTFHYVLIISLIMAVYSVVYEKIRELTENKKYAVLGAVVATAVLVIMPSFELLSAWVISNTYCMVLMLFLMIGIQRYIDKGKNNKQLLWLLSFLIVWLALSRAEMCVCMAGLIVFMTFLPFDKNELLILSIPMVVFQIVFLVRLDIQQVNSEKKVYDTMLTPAIQVIMIMSMLICVAYCFWCDKYIFKRFREKIGVITIVMLPAICLGLLFIDFDKYLTNIDAIFYNFKNELWGYTPIFLLILIVFTIIVRRKITFYGLFAYGYTLLNLIFSLVRKQPLRYGYGDSCNRMLISALPIVFTSIVVGILDAEERGQLESGDKELDYAGSNGDKHAGY